MFYSHLYLQLKPQSAAQCFETLQTMLKDTHAFEGNVDVSLVRLAANQALIKAHWQQEQDYSNYLQWRETNGDAAVLESFLTAIPISFNYSHTDIQLHLTHSI